MCHTTITREDELTERLFQGTIHTLELFSIYLGKELGLYRALHAGPRQTAAELATRAGIAAKVRARVASTVKVPTQVEGRRAFARGTGAAAVVAWLAVGARWWQVVRGDSYDR